VRQITELTGNTMSAEYAKIVASRFEGVINTEEVINLAQSYKRENVEGDATPRDMANTWRSYLTAVTKWLVDFKVFSIMNSSQFTFSNRPRARYVIAASGAGKSHYIRLARHEYLIDGDHLVQGRRDWSDFKSGNLQIKIRAREKYARRVVELVRNQGKVVIAAHDDPVTLSILLRSGIPVVWVKTSDDACFEARIRRDGLARTRAKLQRRRDPEFNSRLCREIRDNAWHHRKSIPVASSIDQAVWLDVFAEWLDYTKEYTSGANYTISGVRTDHVADGEYKYLSTLPMMRVSDIAEVTALKSVGRIQMAADARGVSFIDQFVKELTNVDRGEYATLCGVYGNELKYHASREANLQTDLTGTLQPGLLRSFLSYYWSCATASYLARVQTPTVIETSEEALALRAYKAAFLRDRASLYSRV
jgi:hypothetical protein